MKYISIVLLALGFSSLSHAAYTQESYWIHGRDRAVLAQLNRIPEITIDHVHATGFEVYGPPGLGAWLNRAKIRFSPLQQASLKAAEYPRPEQIEEQLKSLAAAYPQTARLFSIGRSVQGRDLWVMKVSHRVARDDARPEFKYIANMHGNEIVGRELMVRLIADLLQNDGRDPAVTQLLETTQIYIMPSMNPDGAAAARRGNANWVDLNRDFPDFSIPGSKNTPEGRAVETQAIMRWQASRKFTLSANFHGGAEVVNYPWDTVPDAHPMQDLVKNLSLEYAKNAPYIANSTTFENGITNGYAWYEVNGGMQDWSYNWYRDLQLTVELSNQKWPSYGTIEEYYQRNRLALLTYIARVHQMPPMTPRR